MKKTLVAIAALAAVSAFAQSSVTIYGRVDAALTKPSVAAGPAPFRIDAGNGTSRLGFRGVEDLGGGMRATFDLQHRFQVETGANDGSGGLRPFWQGNSFVGLGGTWGDVHIGRRLTAYRNLDQIGDPWGTERVANIGAATVDSDTRNSSSGPNGAGFARTDQIYYESPSMSGFKAAVSIGLKTGDLNPQPVSPTNLVSTAPVNTGAAGLFSTALWYGNGPILAGFGYESNRAKDKGYTLGGQYDFGVARAYAGYVLKDPVGINNNTKTLQLGVAVPAGAATIKAGFNRASFQSGAASTTKLGLGMDYSLSKRTKLFTNIGKPKGQSTAFDFGVQHNF